jgi:ribosomal protein L11 methyltransferase
MIEITIPAEEDLRQQLIAMLGQLGVEGFWEDGDLLKCYVPEQKWSPALQEEMRSVIGMIVSPSSHPLPPMHVQTLAERNWNAEWEKTIQPIHVTPHIVITPSWHVYNAAPGELVLTIDPKMSFGTGYHESTRLILGLVEQYVRQGATVLDIGTGTGILAIAAIRLGAHHAVACDIDEWSYDNAVENAALNGVSEKVNILEGGITVTPDRQYDLVIANIQRNVLIPLLPAMRSRLASGGTLLLAGLLDTDREAMTTALREHGFTILQERTENEWIALAANR